MPTVQPTVVTTGGRSGSHGTVSGDRHGDHPLGTNQHVTTAVSVRVNHRRRVAAPSHVDTAVGAVARTVPGMRKEAAGGTEEEHGSKNGQGSGHVEIRVASVVVGGSSAPRTRRLESIDQEPTSATYGRVSH